MFEESARLRFEGPVLLLGGAHLPADLLYQELQRGFALVAADGGANQLLGGEVIPDAIIGDLDSLLHRDSWARRTRLLHLGEQDSTDFEKCLYSTEAPWYLALGFCGQRLDHTLASLHVLVQRLKTHHVLLLSAEDVIVICDSDVELRLKPGSRLSIFPLSPVVFKRSKGLKYPLHGLELQIGQTIATSNSACQQEVLIEVDERCKGYFALIGPVEEKAAFEALIINRIGAGDQD